MATNKLQWKRIAMGDKLPCQSFLRKKNGEILKLSTIGGVKVGQDCYYLPVDEVINVIKDYPVEESEDERIINNIKKVIGWYRGIFTEKSLMPEEYQEIDAWLEKQGVQKPADIDNKFIRMRETKPKDISEFLDRLTTVEQEFLWEHIAKIRELDKEEQKSAWSEEDEKRLKVIAEELARFISTHKYGTPLSVDDITWLKSLKERIQPKQEWSEEDKNALKVVTDVFEQYGVHLLNYPTFVPWLKALPERISFNPYWKPSEEMDLRKEMDKEWKMCLPIDEGMGLEIASIEHEQFDNIAKHFFELGIKVAQKGEEI